MNLEKIKENLAKKEALKKRKLRKLFDKATEDFNCIVQMIIHTYCPKKIIQWGSLLSFEQFDENSDIDIALEGILDPKMYFSLLGDAMEMTQFPLDIVQLEKIEPEFVDLIYLKGKIIYVS